MFLYIKKKHPKNYILNYFSNYIFTFLSNINLFEILKCIINTT